MSVGPGDYAVPILWSAAEVDALVICSCLPWSTGMLDSAPWRLWQTPAVEAQTPQDEVDGETRTQTTDKPRNKLRLWTWCGRTRPHTSRQTGAGPSKESVLVGTRTSAEVEDLEMVVMRPVAIQHAAATRDGLESPTPVPCEGLAPTVGERMDWVGKVQSFPTKGRSQERMSHSQIGTISRAEAIVNPDRRGRTHERGLRGHRWAQRVRDSKSNNSGSDNNNDCRSKTEKSSGGDEDVMHQGILVVTEVRRVIERDADFVDFAALRTSTPIAGEEQVPSLDQLPLPSNLGICLDP